MKFTLHPLQAVLLAALVSSACVSASGDKRILDDALVSQIQEGVSTRDDVRAQFGRPTDASFTSDGQEVWKYVYSKTKVRATSYIPLLGGLVGGVDTEAGTLTVLFDDAGRVKSIVGGSQTGGGGGLQDTTR